MRVLSVALIFLIGLCAFSIAAFSQSHFYPWLEAYNSSEAIVNRIPVPDGYERINTLAGTFEDWLRHLPLKKGRPPVYLYNGEKKINQKAHYAVVNIDVGDQNLQQCADAIIRLRAEYLYSTHNYPALHFNFTSGDRADFTNWIEGYRPVVNRNKASWIKSQRADSSYQAFRKYLATVFIYAGSFSLSKELHPVQDVNEIKIGDVFIEGGFPGHAVIVVDMAVNKKTGKKLFLLAQSYLPAQDIHILKNPANAALDPWYEADFGEILYTPEWIFSKRHLKRF
ncbi:MAG: DUF4846 domain-containing protein [candidate division KSB1 bacterium]|nr:DUF4846 domain-containing protein [candidate division KSB1 bacterium]